MDFRAIWGTYEGPCWVGKQGPREVVFVCCSVIFSSWLSWEPYGSSAWGSNFVSMYHVLKMDLVTSGLDSVSKPCSTGGNNLPFATTQMDLEATTLSEINQAQKVNTA